MFGLPHRGPVVWALADIESASAAVALLSLDDKRLPHVLSSARVSLPLDKETDEARSADLVTKIGEASDLALSNYVKSMHQNPRVREIRVILHAPWVRSKVVRSEMQFKDDHRITSDAIEECARNAVDSETEYSKENLFEASIVRVRLNGYQTNVPVGKIAQRLSTAALVSECDSALRSAFSEPLSRVFMTHSISFCSTMRALIKTTSSLEIDSRDVVIVSVESDVSTITNIHHGVVKQQATVPEGFLSILRRIAPGKLPDETIGLLRMMAENEGEGATIKELADAIAKTEPDLVRIFGDALMQLANTRRLPPNLVLLADPAISEWLSHFFARIDFTQFTITTQPFSVSIPSARETGRLATFAEGVPFDLGIAIGSALVNSEASV